MRNNIFLMVFPQVDGAKSLSHRASSKLRHDGCIQRGPSYAVYAEFSALILFFCCDIKRKLAGVCEAGIAARPISLLDIRVVLPVICGEIVPAVVGAHIQPDPVATAELRTAISAALEASR